MARLNQLFTMEAPAFIVIPDKKLQNDFRARIAPDEAVAAEHNGEEIYGQGRQRRLAQFWPERVKEFYQVLV